MLYESSTKYVYKVTYYLYNEVYFVQQKLRHALDALSGYCDTIDAVTEKRTLYNNGKLLYIARIMCVI